MIIQTDYPPTNIVVNDIVKTSLGKCYTYIGNFVNYNPPSGFLSVNINAFTATTATTYTSCLSCLTVEPVQLPYTSWNAKGEYSLNCPTCQLTNFGSNISFYTSSATTQIESGVYIYSNTGLTTPINVTYVKYGTKIYKVENDGEINELCTLNKNC
jgi:hypothetical protein